MKRLMTALFSATLIATFFAGTPAPTFADSNETYYIGYATGPGTGCNAPAFVVTDANDGLTPPVEYNVDRLEDNIQAVLDLVEDGDEIVICAGTYELYGDMSTWDGDLADEGETPNPINLTIRGVTGGGTIIDGTIGEDGDIYNALAFEYTNLTLKDLTIRDVDGGAGGVGHYGSAVYLDNGDLTIENVDFEDYHSANGGGAVALNNGDLTVTDSVFDNADGIGTGGAGGAISMDSDDGESYSAVITDTDFYDNWADDAGGAIYASCIDMTITGGEILNSGTYGDGAGIYVASTDCGAADPGPLSVGDAVVKGSLTINDVYFYNNDLWFESVDYGDKGGAIYSVGQDLTIHDSEFSAGDSQNGGAIAMDDYTTGTSALNVYDTDFTDNYAEGNGGALWLRCVNASIEGEMGEGSTTEFDNNDSNDDGGAIFLAGAAQWGEGGAASCDESASLDVTGVAFYGNDADGRGGSIATSKSYPDWGVDGYYPDIAHINVTDSYVQNGEADFGGGIWSGTDVSIIGTSFSNSGARRNGGAIAIHGESSDLYTEDGYFEDGGADRGGAIFAAAINSVTIDGTDFYDNQSGGSGGAIYRTRRYNANRIEDAGINQNIYGDSISNAWFEHNWTGYDPVEDDADWSYSRGGALYTDVTTGITSSTFVDNSTGMDGRGGAITVHNDANLTVSDSLFESNYASYGGGAINFTGHNLSVSSSSFENNEALWNEGGAIRVSSLYSSGSDAEYFDESAISTSISKSLFSGNRAGMLNMGEGYGGALSIRDGSYSVSGSTFSRNSAEDGGGAIYSDSDDVSARRSIKDSLFTYNYTTWGDGGALLAEGQKGYRMDITGVSFSDNSTGVTRTGSDLTKLINHYGPEDGDGYRALSTDIGNGAGAGGAAHITSAQLSVSKSYFRRNSAVGSGGALQAYGGTRFSLDSSTFAGNSSSRFEGGAVAVWDNDATVMETNTFAQNTTANVLDYGWVTGGAVALWVYEGEVARVTSNTFEKNSVRKASGGGLFIWSDSPLASKIQIVTNRFNSNSATTGGGLYLDFRNAGTTLAAQLPKFVSGNSFTSNTATRGAAGAVMFRSGSVKTIQASLTRETKNSKYSKNKSVVRGADNLIAIVEALPLP